MMRPPLQALLSAPLATAAIMFLATSPAWAGNVLTLALPPSPPVGISIGSGTVQPVSDPHGLYTFDVYFNPASGESIQKFDFFSVTSTAPLLFFAGSNLQPTTP